MITNFRQFEVADSFGKTCQVEFAWLQNGISIRHADTVDVKFFVDDGSGEQEIIIALRHTDLLQLSAETGRPLTDPWATRLAALHIMRMIETGEDLEKTLVTPSYADLRTHAASLEQTAASEA